RGAQAGRLAASPCGPPPFSPELAQGRGEHRMRKVVTGSPVAQLRNPDPFAVPAWRSPVYRTPFALVAAVQAARLTWRLARFLTRHPIAALAVLAGGLLWGGLGWPGALGLALSIAVALVVWPAGRSL